MGGFWGIPISLNIRPTNPQDSDTSSRQTVQQMIALAMSCSVHPLIARVVDSCLRTLPPKATKRDLARALWYWVKHHVRFERDERIVSQQLGFEDPNQELVISPIVLLQMPQPMGDCDDFTTLICTLLLCAHLPYKMITVAVDSEEPWRFSHIYAMTYLSDEGRWMAMDVSHGINPGWEVNDRPIYRREEWLVG
jgi:transglutaminase superfamily protein